ncbi:MAG: collagen-like protein [Myxococcales bacterium]|nr:collagen-like protein [Myxococcales bacterium]MCB9581210.1 collagen-like protein [Polyangiaceae bacterium]
MARKFGLLGVSAAAATLLAATAASSAVPANLTQQGRLLDSTGTPVPGSVSITFAVYSAASGGTALWTETQNVTLDDGFFSARLGEATAIPNTVFDGSTRYLGVKVGADAEMTPRQTIVSVPYALMANNAVGDITPTSVSVNGTQVIDGTGNWVGPTAGLVGPTGPQGPAGPAGAVGATGAQGPQGPAGPAGPTGPTGATGSQGPQGVPGAQGPVGPTGPSGVVGYAFASGNGNNPATTTNFMGPTVNVTVTSSAQRVFVNANKAFGTASATGATSLNLYVCYRLSGSTTTPSLVGGAILGNRVTNNTRVPMGISGVFGNLAAGTYTVGMCGSSSDATNWNSNEWGYTSALVFLP